MSTAVVSYVVNDGPRTVAPDTAARVRAAVSALHYRPNAHARALRKGTTQMLGLVLPDITNLFYAEFARELELAAAARGHMLVLASSNASAEVERRIVEDLVGRHVDGLILCTVMAPAELPEHDYAGRPAVFVHTSLSMPGHVTLGADARTGARTVVEHLLDRHGFTSVALVMGGAAEALLETRELGWNDAFRARGLPPGPILRTSFNRQGGHDAAAEILRWTPRPQAIFASSDQQATGVLAAIREAGLRCPEDVAVVSFDGTSESEFSGPPLTTVRQPLRAMATAAVDVVLDAGPAEPGLRQFATELVVRSSCGCPSS